MLVLGTRPQRTMTTTCRGFQLLSKMGFQPGQGLGRAKQGRVEPLPLHVKQTKTGVGVDEANRAAKRAAQQQEAARGGGRPCGRGFACLLGSRR